MKVSEAELIKSCAKPRDFPRTDLPEIAFLGRSNVGKSSLLNKLAKRKKLARTSSTPGKTRLIHFFRVVVGESEFSLVDLPGYGWAKVSRRERQSWGTMVEGYLENRETLRAAILLQDVRRDFTDDEILLLEWLAERDIYAIVALTKADKLKPMQRKNRIQKLRSQIQQPQGGILATSSEKGLGIDELWRAIYERIEA